MEDIEDTLFSKGGLLYGCTSASWYTLHKKLRILGYGDLWDAGDANTSEYGKVWLNHPSAGKVILGDYKSLSRKKAETIQKIIDERIQDRYDLLEAINMAWREQRRRRKYELQAAIIHRKELTIELLGRMVKGYIPRQLKKTLIKPPRYGVKQRISKMLSSMGF